MKFYKVRGTIKKLFAQVYIKKQYVANLRKFFRFSESTIKHIFFYKIAKFKYLNISRSLARVFR